MSASKRLQTLAERTPKWVLRVVTSVLFTPLTDVSADRRTEL